MTDNEDINLSWAFFQKLKKALKCSPLINLALSKKCSYNPLDITRDLGTLELADRWFSENLKFISISNSLFMKNSKGQPVLSKNHQLVIKTLMRFKIAIVLKGNRFSCREMTQYEVNHRCECAGGNEISLSSCFCYDRPFTSYLYHLFKTHIAFKDEEEKRDSNYWNFLQTPLQPLMDNLSSGTYEIFENDKIKYSLYGKAIQAALVDFKISNWFNQNLNIGEFPNHIKREQYEKTLLEKSMKTRNDADDSMTGIDPVEVMVFGAGRGPLIIKALQASENWGVPIHITAVDKNRYAIIEIKKLIEK